MAGALIPDQDLVCTGLTDWLKPTNVIKSQENLRFSWDLFFLRKESPKGDIIFQKSSRRLLAIRPRGANLRRLHPSDTSIL